MSAFPILDVPSSTPPKTSCELVKRATWQSDNTLSLPKGLHKSASLKTGKNIIELLTNCLTNPKLALTNSTNPFTINCSKYIPWVNGPFSNAPVLKCHFFCTSGIKLGVPLSSSHMINGRSFYDMLTPCWFWKPIRRCSAFRPVIQMCRDCCHLLHSMMAWWCIALIKSKSQKKSAPFHLHSREKENPSTKFEVQISCQSVLYLHFSAKLEWQSAQSWLKFDHSKEMYFVC